MATAPAEEAALVVAALRALRREHEPAKASALLDRYLHTFPNGVLVEEAMAIAIEAGLAGRDQQGARRLADDYLRRFPTGQFTRLARKAAGTRP